VTRDDDDDNNNNNNNTYIHVMGSATVTVQNIILGRSNITCSTNCKYRTAATLYPINMGCFRYIIVNALHKGDDNIKARK
jgi:hypothetical protein